MIDLSHHIVPVHVIGRKNSGKTTLICELVRELCSQGYRVGSIKHTSHRHEFDTPGKDSQRHRVAGAVISGIVSSGLCGVLADSESVEDDPRDSQLYDEYDLCWSRGHAHVPRKSRSGVPSRMARRLRSGIEVQAVVTDEPLPGCLRPPGPDPMSSDWPVACSWRVWPARRLHRPKRIFTQTVACNTEH
jgi:molybdopterin-guanine dinucleotide biosynthesis protein B